MSPGRAIHRDHIDVAIGIGAEHDAEFIACLGVASPIQQNVAVLDGQVGLHPIYHLFFDQQHIQTDGRGGGLCRSGLSGLVIG